MSEKPSAATSRLSTAPPTSVVLPTRHWRIVCDIDDVLWPLNVTVAHKLSIPLEKLVDFRVSENPLLTPAERAILTASYSDPDTFKNMQFYEGIEQLLGLEELGVKLELHSNCYNPDVAEFKHQNILRAIPGIREDQIYCKVIDPEQSGQKKLPENMLILIDDSPYTVATSQAKLNILPYWPYNATDKARAMMCGKDLCYVQPGNLPQLVDILRKMIPSLLHEHGQSPA